MQNKKYLLLEAAGGLFIAAASAFMQHLYSLSGQELLGILFGAVNGSVWEACKTLLLPFFIWALLEALIYRTAIYKYTASKTISLYTLGALYILLRQTALSPQFSAAVSVAAAVSLSVFLYISPLPLQILSRGCATGLFFRANIPVPPTAPRPPSGSFGSGPECAPDRPGRH